ncbi:MAG: glycosyltransferase family 2 protein, partial [Verrucomicrobiae bacterium]|nr:glycosyltransferase family 2 protein [Verrucomicrobiae bacterium]
MKLIIQVPCFNEEACLAESLAALPRKVAGFDSLEVLVVDDGSVDRTCEIARASGAHHVLSLGSHQGLARAFQAGLQRSLELGADVVVNTDADNQYHAGDIEKLVQPILERRADIVIGCRPISRMDEFSALKKMLQGVGSRVVCWAANQDIPDVTTGFRAYNREAVLRLDVRSSYTYTHETIIQASRKQ